MIDTTIPFASTGVLGAPGAGARIGVCPGVPSMGVPSMGVRSWAGPTVTMGGGVPVQGTGVPSAGKAQRLRRLTTPGGVLAPIAGTDAATRPVMHQFHLLFTNDGTTPLGIHPPGGPTS